MQFFIHLGTNLEYFELLNKEKLLWQGKSDRDLASFFMKHFPWELADSISPQYEVNFMALREIKRRFGNDFFNKIDGIYYWSDNCEYLVPTQKELESAFIQFKEFEKVLPPHTRRTFSFVTPYVWDKMMERLEEWLNYLNNLKTKHQIEVIVNDFWVLRVCENKYPNLKIVFWRLIHKVLKTPLIDTFWYEVHPAWELIKNKTEQEKNLIKDEIIKWQLKFYNSSEVNLDIYRKFLSNHNISRVALDYMEKREELFDNTKSKEVGIDLYYPWALIFTGRLCDTSAIENPSRGYYATDDICPRTCNRFDVGYKVKTVWYKMIQRGNAAYRSELNLDYLSDDFSKNSSNRLVFAPFITV